MALLKAGHTFSIVRSTDVIQSITCSTVNLCQSVLSPTLIGPLIDCGAPYSALGAIDPQKLASFNLPDWGASLLALYDYVRDGLFSQYRRDTHASAARAIL